MAGLTKVTTGGIEDGTILNADINTSASIDASKVSGLVTDKIEEGNTNVEVVDAGPDGHITFDTNGSERLRIDNSGNVFLGGTTASSANFALNAAGGITSSADCIINPGSINVYKGSSNSPVWNGGWKANVDGTPTTNITTTISSSGTINAANGKANISAVTDGAIINVRNDNTGQNAFEVYNGGTALSNLRAHIGSDGSGNFAGSITASGTLTLNKNYGGNSSGSVKTLVINSGGNNSSGVMSEKIAMFADGKITSEARIISTDSSSGGAGANDKYSYLQTGVVSVRNDSSDTALEVASVGGGVNCTITGGGAISAAGTITGGARVVVNADGTKGNSDNAFYLYQDDGSTVSVSMTAGGSATFAGKITSQGNAALGAADGSIIDGQSGFSASIGNSSSLLFRGYTTGNSTPRFSVTAGGLIYTAGGLTSQNTVTVNAPIIANRSNGNDHALIAQLGGNNKVVIQADGDASFAGNVLIGKTSVSQSTVGTQMLAGGATEITTNSDRGLLINRKNNDGQLVAFDQDGTTEGSISVSGSTVSYNGAHLARWSQLPGGAERTEILRGSVLSNLDEMCEWAYPAQDAVLYTDKDELLDGASVGDVKTPAVSAGKEDNEQLNRMKVSDTEGDKNVSGVFQAWDDDDDTYTNDFYCAMTGDFVIRIAQGTTVARGDLLMSAGDGTAKPQDDDIVRSKTIAKVTSTTVSETYSDGSYCVPCVLMAC